MSDALLSLMPKDWSSAMGLERVAEHLLPIDEFLNTQSNQAVFPAKNDIFNALEFTPFKQVKVVILGQDPYHGEGQAHGLAFSVQDGCQFPPSLKNIFKELESDVGVQIPMTGNLTSWAKQGVLLLNTVLTVESAQANSHKNKGWEALTDDVIRTISDKQSNVVFVLWGKPALKKIQLIDERKHLVLQSAHPSPLSSYRGFFGSRPFSQINDYLVAHKKSAINWSV